MPFYPPNIDEFAFLFDVDGTLADIAPTPDDVRISHGLRRNLERLSHVAKGAVALVSGRSLGSLDALFEPLELTAIGGHGAEMRLLDNGHVEHVTEPPLADLLRQRFTAIAALDPKKIIVEDKEYSVAIHYRLARDKERAILDAVAAICSEIDRNAVEVLHGKAVVEIKKSGFNKGTAIRALMAHPPFAGRRPIFIGDDITDEDAFAVMPEFNGIAISVGRMVKGVTLRFEAPSDVRRWVERISQADDRRPADH